MTTIINNRRKSINDSFASISKWNASVDFSNFKSDVHKRLEKKCPIGV